MLVYTVFILVIFADVFKNEKNVPLIGIYIILLSGKNAG